VKVDAEIIRTLICHAITESNNKLTPGAIDELVKKKMPDARSRDIRRAIKSLVDGGELSYSYTFGSSFIERSFNRPVRVTKKIVLMPPGKSYPEKHDAIPIIIQPGVSFGVGEHPTTRLALSGLETAMMDRKGKGKSMESALDIGTGTGVLAIAAVRCGLKKAVGIDTDPCARWEAEKNISLNGLGDCIDITDRSVNDLQRSYDLVIANLRLPTLKMLCPAIKNLTLPAGSVVFSGIKTEETQGLTDLYLQEGFHAVWKAEEKGWAGIVLLRR